MGSPFSLMQRLADDMDQLFSEFGFGRGLSVSPWSAPRVSSGLFGRGSALEPAVWSPQVETFRRGDKFIVRADLPGLKKDDVKVEVEDDVLTISGERTDEHEENRDGFYRSERSYGQFYRAIPLPEAVDPDQCDASFKDGVLEVSFRAPKESERKSKQISIR
jgi:HSP20 family protein